MKKILAVILSIILIFSCFSTFVLAENVRPLKTKFYLHYKNTSSGTQYDAVALSSKGKLDAGEYVVSFSFSNPSSYSAFFILGMNSRSAIGSSYSSVHHSGSTGIFPSSTLLTNSASSSDASAGVRTYKFTLTEEQAAYNYQYFGFYIQKAAGAEFKVYISDFILYKADDTTKTNLLDTNDYKTNLNNWYGNAYAGQNLLNVSRFVKIGYVPYEEQIVDINLNNSLYKLSNATDSDSPTFKVGFIGGSVTNGSGATDANTTSWRARTRDWIKSSFPNAEITEVEAAIGATGSFYGMYRAEKHLIKEKAPDLCFIEFAINDAPGYDALFDNTIHNNYTNLETIIKKIYASNPYADIVFVVTGDRNWLKADATSENPIFGTTHTELAEYYSLPVIYAGRELAQDIYVENGNTWPDSDTHPVWAKYYTDYVHPTDLGYEHYANTVIDYLKSQWLAENSVTTEYIDKTQSSLYPTMTFAEVNEMGELYLDADMIYPNELNPANLGGFNWSESGEYYPLISKTAGDSITLEFNSSNFGIWVQGKPSGTDFTYSIDGGEEITKNIKTQYLSACMMLAEGLGNEQPHTITITHNDSNDLNISYFLMSDMPEGESATLSAINTDADAGNNSQKTMLHIGYHNSDTSMKYDKIALSTKGKLEAGDYVVSFTMDSGYSNVTSFMIIGTPTFSNLYGKVPHHASNTSQFTNSPTALVNTGSGNRIEYKFTLTEEQAESAYQRFGFYLVKSGGAKFDINIADFTVYKADDASKINLLDSNRYKSDLTGWASDSYTGEDVTEVLRFSEFEYVAYQPELFKTALKINITRSATASSTPLEYRLAQKVNGALVAGKEYTIEFNYYMTDDSTTLPIVSVYGSSTASNLETAKVLRSSSYLNTTRFGGVGVYGNKVKYTFTLTDTEDDYAYYAVGFYPRIPAGADYTFYVSDFTVYETSDAYKNNLLYNDNYVTTVNNWLYAYGGFTGSTSTQSTNAKLSSVLYGTGDANCDDTLDIRDLVRFDSDSGTNSACMNPLADMDDNCALDKNDFTIIRKRLLDIQY